MMMMMAQYVKRVSREARGYRFQCGGVDIASRTGITFMYTFLRCSSKYRFSEAGELFPNETLVEEGSHY